MEQWLPFYVKKQKTDSEESVIRGEELDYSLLYQAYSAKDRNPAVDPRTMCKILTYAYFQNIYSSRKIQQEP